MIGLATRFIVKLARERLGPCSVSVCCWGFCDWSILVFGSFVGGHTSTSRRIAAPSYSCRSVCALLKAGLWRFLLALSGRQDSIDNILVAGPTVERHQPCFAGQWLLLFGWRRHSTGGLARFLTTQTRCHNPLFQLSKGHGISHQIVVLRVVLPGLHAR